MKPATFWAVGCLAVLLCQQPGRAELSTYEGQPVQRLDVQSLVDNAARSGQSSIELPSGVFSITTDCLTLNRVNNLRINGNNTVLLFHSFTRSGIGITNCKNITLSNFTIDYDPLPFTQGVVTAVEGPGVYDIAIDAGYPDLSKDYQIDHPLVFDTDTKGWKAGIPDEYARSVQILDPRHGRMEMVSKSAQAGGIGVGDSIVLNARNVNAINMNASENVRIDHLIILSAPGAGVLGRFMRGDNYFTYTIKKGPPPAGATASRLISTSADGFNYGPARKGPTLERCDFSFQGDDSVNLHGLVVPVVQVLSPTSFLTVRTNAGEAISYVTYPGDTARLLAPNTFAILGNAPVDHIDRVSDGPQIDEKTLNSYYPSVTNFANATYYRVTLQKPIDMQVGQYFDFPDIDCPNFVIRECYFHDHRARAIRIMASHGVIEDNTIERIRDSAITLGPQYAFWREAGWVSDVTIRGNKIDDVVQGADGWASRNASPGAIAVFAALEQPGTAQIPVENHDIHIVNNRVNGCSVSGIMVNAAHDVTLQGNSVENTNRVRSAAAGGDHGLNPTKSVYIAPSTANIKKS